MKRFYDTELDTFRSHLQLMGEHATIQVRDALRALATHDETLACQIISRDETLNTLEVKIDDEAVRYMNLRAPVATTLRLVIVGMKISNNLERIGDEASNIARRVKRLNVYGGKIPLPSIPDELPIMAETALGMLATTLGAFTTGDLAESTLRAVIERDAQVDDLNKRVYRGLTHDMTRRPAAISSALELTFIAKSLERIADHATNIAEELIYLTQGKDIRHETHSVPPATIP
jgi:phosphate transport system protein